MRTIKTIAFILSMTFLSLHMIVEHSHDQEGYEMVHCDDNDDASNLLHLLISVLQENLGTSHLEDFLVEEPSLDVNIYFEVACLPSVTTTTSISEYYFENTKVPPGNKHEAILKRGPPPTA